MYLAIIAIIILVGAYSLRKLLYRDRAYSPTNLFCLWWAACLAMSLYPVWGRNVASDEIYGSILLAVIAFLIGSVLGEKRYSFHASRVASPQENNRRLSNGTIEEAIPHTAIQVINAFSLVLNCWLFMKCFSKYGAEMFAEVGIARSDIYADDGILDGIFAQYLHSYLMRPLLYALVVYLPAYFGAKKHNGIMLFSTFNILFYTFIYGGRMFMFYMGILLLVGTRIRDLIVKAPDRRRDNIFIIRIGRWSKNKKRMWFMVALLVVLVILLSFQRNHSSQENGLKYFIEKSITYFSTAPAYYQYLQEQTTVAEQSGFHFTLIGGLFSLLSKLNVFVGFKLFPYAVEDVSTHLTSYLVNVGGRVYTNAFPTMVYTFRYDFGMIGVFLNSFAFGFISEQVYRRLIDRRNCKWFCFYMIAVYFVMESPMRWTGQQHWPFVVIPIVLLVDKLSRKRQ